MPDERRQIEHKIRTLEFDVLDDFVDELREDHPGYFIAASINYYIERKDADE
jgi:hypothetical protein